MQPKVARRSFLGALASIPLIGILFRRETYCRRRAVCVDSRNGVDSVCAGESFQKPVATLAYALKRAKPGDVIYLAPGHAESMGTPLVLDVPRVQVLGHPKGRPTFRFNPDKAACAVSVRAPDCAIKNCNFIAGE